MRVIRVRGKRAVIDITDEEMANLPEDPEEAFIALERIVRKRLHEAQAAVDENEDTTPFYRRYMSFVLPAAKHYGISGLAHWERPKPNDDYWNTYTSFIADVDYCLSALRLQKAEKVKQHSVKLDPAAKLKFRHMLAQLRETVDSLNVSVAKKEALYKRINALQEEIDRDRTRYQAFAALMIEACDDVGQAAKKLEPLVRQIERLGAAFGAEKRAEDAKPKLPPRKEPKQIEYKKNGYGDDEMPF